MSGSHLGEFSQHQGMATDAVEQAQHLDAQFLIKSRNYQV